MKKLTILLMLSAFVVVLASTSAFALGKSFRYQATAGLFDDPADDIVDGTDVIRYYPKWVLLTRFSNLLGTVSGGGASSEDQILDYGSNGANSDYTFYGLMGSSEWFETNLGMPVNFAFSYQRDGARLNMLKLSDGTVVNGGAGVVYSATGDGYAAGEYSDRRASADFKDNEWNLTAGYKVNDSMWAGLTWKHAGAKIRHINDGELDDGAETSTYGTGLAKDVLTAATEDTFNGIVRMAMNDDMHVKGYATLGYYTSRDNRASFETNASIPMATASGTLTGDLGLPMGASDVVSVWSGGLTPATLPQQLDLDVADTERNLEITSKANGLIFSLKGRVYYYPLYKGSIYTDLKYGYRGGSIAKTEVVSDGTDDETYTVSGKQSRHTFDWTTERKIKLENITTVLGLYWQRSSTTTIGDIDWESDVTGAEDAEYSVNEKSVTHTWKFPVGAELSFKENWTFRVGSEHEVELNTTTTDVSFDNGVTDGETTDVTKSDTRSTSYKYGVGYAWSENLQLDINGFLVETPDAGVDDRADILDLSTYRNLAISATLTF